MLLVKSLAIEILEGWLFEASFHALSEKMLVELIFVIKARKLLLLMGLLLLLRMLERVFLLEPVRESLIRIAALRKLK